MQNVPRAPISSPASLCNPLPPLPAREANTTLPTSDARSVVVRLQTERFIAFRREYAHFAVVVLSKGLPEARRRVVQARAGADPIPLHLCDRLTVSYSIILMHGPLGGSCRGNGNCGGRHEC